MIATEEVAESAGAEEDMGEEEVLADNEENCHCEEHYQTLRHVVGVGSSEEGDMAPLLFPTSTLTAMTLRPLVTTFSGRTVGQSGALPEDYKSDDGGSGVHRGNNGLHSSSGST